MNTLVRENQNGRQSEQLIAPAASVSENIDGYTLQIEMPGVNKEGLEISIENNELTIMGWRSMPAVDGSLIHRESRAENFRRAFAGFADSTTALAANPAYSCSTRSHI